MLQDANGQPLAPMWASSPVSAWDMFADPSHRFSARDMLSGCAAGSVLSIHSMCGGGLRTRERTEMWGAL